MNNLLVFRNKKKGQNPFQESMSRNQRRKSKNLDSDLESDLASINSRSKSVAEMAKELNKKAKKGKASKNPMLQSTGLIVRKGSEISYSSYPSRGVRKMNEKDKYTRPTMSMNGSWVERLVPNFRMAQSGMHANLDTFPTQGSNFSTGSLPRQQYPSTSETNFS